ncbi:MAG: glycosyltransferase family A protein [Candidatus Omnitrophota bacterium]
MKKVSLYIPCYNAESHLEKSLRSVFEQTYPIHEILIINDASTDNSVAICQKYPVKIISHHENLGLSAARNTALENCATEFIASVDADVILKKDWLETIMRNFTDERICGVGGQLIESCINNVADQWRNQHMRQWWGEKLLLNPDFIFGHSNVFHKERLLEAGGYNPLFRTNGEDFDVCRKLKQKGYSLVYDPSAIAFHLKTDTIRSILISAWRYSAWSLLLEKKTLPKMFKRALRHFLNSIKWIRHDLQSKKLGLILIDIISPFISIYLDLTVKK